MSNVLIDVPAELLLKLDTAVFKYNQKRLAKSRRQSMLLPPEKVKEAERKAAQLGGPTNVRVRNTNRFLQEMRDEMMLQQRFEQVERNKRERMSRAKYLAAIIAQHIDSRSEDELVAMTRQISGYQEPEEPKATVKKEFKRAAVTEEDAEPAPPKKRAPRKRKGEEGPPW